MWPPLCFFAANRKACFHGCEARAKKVQGSRAWKRARFDMFTVASGLHCLNWGHVFDSHVAFVTVLQGLPRLLRRRVLLRQGDVCRRRRKAQEEKGVYGRLWTVHDHKSPNMPSWCFSSPAHPNPISHRISSSGAQRTFGHNLRNLRC